MDLYQKNLKPCGGCGTLFVAPPPAAFCSRECFERWYGRPPSPHEETSIVAAYGETNI